jgi:hypothetical protein
VAVGGVGVGLGGEVGLGVAEGVGVGLGGEVGLGVAEGVGVGLGGEVGLGVAEGVAVGVLVGAGAREALGAADASVGDGDVPGAVQPTAMTTSATHASVASVRTGCRGALWLFIPGATSSPKVASWAG